MDNKGREPGRGATRQMIVILVGAVVVAVGIAWIFHAIAGILRGVYAR